ncbi:MAG: FGGY-family carbohydrate kinase [Pseudomonadota bacterium]
MPRPHEIILGIDQGTTNTKVVALNSDGVILADAVRPIATSAPEPGFVEQDASAMVANVLACIRELLERLALRPSQVLALGISNQTETLVVWDRTTGHPVMPAIVWQCRRGAEELERLRSDDSLRLIRARTGLDLDPTFTAGKLHWLKRNRPGIWQGLRDGRLRWGTVDCWLIWALSQGGIWATEPGNASRTMLFDIAQLSWDKDLCALFDLDLADFPEVRRSDGDFGTASAELLGAAIPIRGVMGDQQAALFGHGCFAARELKVTYGTGAFLWMNAGTRPPESAGDGIIRTIAWQTDQTCYAYEGFVMYAGKILDWLSGRLSVEGRGAAVAALAETTGTSGEVLLVPAFQGLASPWWQPDVRAALLGLSEATDKGQIAHAGLEAVCFQIRAVLDRLSGGAPLPMVKTDGSMTRSAYFNRMQASVLGTPLFVSASDAMTPFGCALMAGLGAGRWASLDDLRKIPRPGETVSPSSSYQRAYEDWTRAVDLLIEGYGRGR